ncbi:MAG: hypothetical protein OHK0028_07780 [Deltaproteobacteria bacterium]
MSKVNPFAPNSPVPHGMFVGRIEEINRLDTCLTQTKSGRPANFMITGERGIGKSSLLNYIKYVANGLIKINGSKLNFLVIDTDIDKGTTQLGLIKKIQLGLDRALGETEAARTLMKDLWKFIQRVEVGSARIKPGERSDIDELLSEEFSYSLAEVTNRICCVGEEPSLFTTNKDGILILIDEADNGSRDLDLGTFFKLLTERLQRRSCNKIAFGLAGLSELRNVLFKSHPSSLRIFEELVLGRLSGSEINRVIDMCLKEANSTNEIQTMITDIARAYLVSYSEGYPHFIQQFGSSAFTADVDNVIDEKDVAKGAFGDRGALELIGDRYYRDNFYNKIQKDSYRQVLRIMADKLDGWVTKQEIRKKFRGKTTTLDNAITALRDRKIIFSKEGEKGVYRLQHKGFAFWIKMYTTDPSELESAAPSQSVVDEP